jgi:zinc resistance-associated protein
MILNLDTYYPVAKHVGRETGYFLPGSWYSHTSKKPLSVISESRKASDIRGLEAPYHLVACSLPNSKGKNIDKGGLAMKRLAMILGIVVLVGAVAVPVFAWGPGWGWGHHMMGYWGSGPGYAGSYENLTSEQRSQLDTLNSKFYDETAGLRNQVWTKNSQLDSILNRPNPDLEKAKALQKEISELRAKLDEKRLSYELEARKIAPQEQLGGAYAGGYGYHMGGFGPGMGYGPGACWY